jgi:hypothetical protein
MSLTKLSLGGNYDVIYKLFLPRESLVSDIPAEELGTGILKSFFTVYALLFRLAAVHHTVYKMHCCLGWQQYSTLQTSVYV